VKREYSAGIKGLKKKHKKGKNEGEKREGNEVRL
jgi:hypothetical protein